MSDPILKPCPFCGDDKRLSIDMEKVAIWCASCMCHGPVTGNGNDAIALWNSGFKSPRNRGVFDVVSKLRNAAYDLQSGITEIEDAIHDLGGAQ